jgi:ABC-2 type transport system ATP-binding protein
MLFLDEPTAGVDPISRREFWDLLYRFAAQGRTIFVTTHYMDEAEHCARLSFIQDGRLVAIGSPQEIKREKMHGQVLEVECDKPDLAMKRLRAAGSLAGRDIQVALYGASLHVVAEDVADLRPAIKETLTQAGLEIQSMELIAPSLEDVFVASVRDVEQSAVGGQPSASADH